MNKSKLKRIITVALLSMAISIIGIKSFFYLEHHIKYKKITKLNQPKKIKTTKIIKNKTPTSTNSYADIINKLLGKNLLHNQNKKKQSIPKYVSYDEFVEKTIKHAKQEKEAEEKKQQELLAQQKAKKQAELAKNQPQWFDIILTYYTNNYNSCGKTDGIGASNIKLNRGSVAAPREIPMLTKLHVDKLGDVTVHDRGGAITRVWENGKEYIKLDVFIPNATERELNKLGKVYTKGYIINN